VLASARGLKPARWSPFHAGLKACSTCRNNAGLPSRLKAIADAAQGLKIAGMPRVKCWLFVMVRDEAPDARQKRSDHHRWRSGDPRMGIVGWQACHTADSFGDHAGVVASRKLPSFAVARNCGIGSSSLNAEVNAFDRLHMVRGWNSWCCGLK